MYVVEVNRHSVICQTPEAVHALTSFAVNGHSNGVAKTYKPRKLKTKAGEPDRRREGITASWDKARRVAKRLGRKDVMAVRSELRAGKLTEE